MFVQHTDEPHAEDAQAESELTVNKVLTDLNLSNFAELFAKEQIDIDCLVSYYFYFLILSTYLLLNFIFLMARNVILFFINIFIMVLMLVLWSFR